MTAGVIWPTSIAVRVSGDNGKDDAGKSSETAEAAPTVNYKEFFDAAKSGSLEVLEKYLLDPDFDVNHGDNAEYYDGGTALYKACKERHFDIVQRLLRHDV
jgi:hypothetical protein